MKCVCPMGGDRTCPDNCIIAVWHSTPEDQRTKERRRPLVEALAKQGYTQEAIAMQLGVSQKTVSNDIQTLVTVTNVKGQGKDTRGRKKSTGRPKGKKQAPQLDAARQIVRVKLASGEEVSRDELNKQHGVALGTGSAAIAAEQARQQAFEEKTALDPSHLSKTAQQKLDAAIRAHTRKLDVEYEARAREEVRRWLNEVSLPQYAKELGELERSIASRKGIMDRITYRKILACLHVERLIQLLDISLDKLDASVQRRYDEAFQLFTKLEKRVLDEKESPTEFRRVPRTYEELMAMKAKVQAERRARRASKSNINAR